MITGFGVSWFRDHIRRPPHWIYAIAVDNVAPVEECTSEQAEQYMSKIGETTEYQPGELDGFTLFIHPGKGWQMSVRRKDEPGWSVKIIPDEKAQAILSLLTASGHPDNPMKVRLLEASAAAARSELTAVVRALAAR